MRTQQDTLVIAEDNPAIFAALETTFFANGFRVERLTNLKAIKNECWNATPFVLILGDIGRVSFLSELRAVGQECPVIFLHSQGSVSKAVKAMQAGADDYFSHPFCPQTLLQSVLAATTKARRQFQAAATKRAGRQCVTSLTQREREIIHLALAGLLNKEIAEHLRLALITVKVHRGKAMRKIGARTPAELARIAQELGIVAPPPLAMLCPPVHQATYQSVGP